MQVLIVFAFILAVASAGVIIPEPLATPVHPRDLDEVQTPTGRITNGQTAKEGQFPYQVALNFGSSQGGWFCGASLIGTEWILTAAHCTNGATTVQILMGSVDRANPKLKVTATKENFRQHENYNAMTLRNDISLIKIPAVGFSNLINKIKLPATSSSYSTYSGQNAIASGFGKMSDASNTIAPKMQYASLKVIDNVDCSKVYGTLTVTSSTLCTATPNKRSTCSGDSGGPLVWNNDILIGVTSFVSSNGCESGNPAGFARVTSFLDFISKNTGIKY